MQVFFVTPDPIQYKNLQNELIPLTQEDIKTKLGVDFTSSSTVKAQVFASEAHANEWALYSVDPKATHQHAVVTLDIDFTEEEFKKLPKVTRPEHLAKIYDVNGDIIKLLEQHIIDANRATIIKVSFAHADKNAKDVNWKQDEQKSVSKLNEILATTSKTDSNDIEDLAPTVTKQLDKVTKDKKVKEPEAPVTLALYKPRKASQ